MKKLTLEERLLLGLDGSTTFNANDALARLKAVAEQFGVFAVKVMAGSAVRECSIGTGHRPALTLLERLVSDRSAEMVTLQVTV